MENEKEQQLERVKKAEEVAAQCQAEAGVYRDLLNKCHEAASKAIETNNIAFVYEIEKQTRLAADESLVKELGRILIHSFWSDKAWLSRTFRSLEKIKVLAERLTIEEGSSNAKIKDEILEAAKDGLIQQL